jgi:hypothetical protein
MGLRLPSEKVDYTISLVWHMYVVNPFLKISRKRSVGAFGRQVGAYLHLAHNMRGEEANKKEGDEGEQIIIG